MDFKILLDKITPTLRYIARKHILRGFYDEDDLYQEMCFYLWQEYGQGLPVGINESYAIKGCEFHVLNFLRKGRVRFRFVSLDKPVGEAGSSLKDFIEDRRTNFLSDLESRLTIEDVKKKGLTKKEQRVLSFLVKGYTVREIAKNIGTSHVMVLKYKKSIIKKAKIRGYQD